MLPDTTLAVPDVGVPVGRTGDNPVGLGCPVNPSHTQVMLVQHGLAVALASKSDRVDLDTQKQRRLMRSHAVKNLRGIV